MPIYTSPPGEILQSPATYSPPSARGPATRLYVDNLLPRLAGGGARRPAGRPERGACIICLLARRLGRRCQGRGYPPRAHAPPTHGPEHMRTSRLPPRQRWGPGEERDKAMGRKGASPRGRPGKRRDDGGELNGLFRSRHQRSAAWACS